MSIVRPGGQRIADGTKTIEVRRWQPGLGPDEDILIVQNERFLMNEGDEDPHGRVVAIVRVAAVRAFTTADMQAACATSFEEGWLSWELSTVRRVKSSSPVLAARQIYELALPLDAVVEAVGSSDNDDG